jgi:hypothetical protein
VQALDENGQPATAFNGAVTLSSTWGDVRVCASSTSCPSASSAPTVQLTAGVAKGQSISLDRETSPPQSAILRASFAAAVGTSGSLRITVNSPVFTRASAPLIAPVTGPANAWGWADVAVGAPYVLPTAGQFQLFVLGYLASGVGTVPAIGSGSSSDGKSFTPDAMPIVQASDPSAAASIGSPAAIVDVTGLHLYYARAGALAGYAGFDTLESESAPGFMGPYSSPTVALDLTSTPSDCPYCLALDAPALIADPTPALNGGVASAKILYFSTVQSNTTGGSGTQLSIVRAYAADGINFAVDPSPLIKSTSEEAIIYAPRVLVDGTVFKMWYSYETALETVGSLSPCATPGAYRVGYATSSDGYFWVRSPRNLGAAQPAAAAEAPAMDVSTTGWDANASVLVGSVVPTDGVDPANGLSLYYSPFSGTTLKCLPNGVGLATHL